MNCINSKIEEKKGLSGWFCGTHCQVIREKNFFWPKDFFILQIEFHSPSYFARDTTY